MRVVSLVPSWTETLIHAGCNVVGRTRFCIHPDDKVRAIPAVGGTKDWNWVEIQALKPDLLILDREENPKFMADQTEIPFVDTHVEGIGDVAPNLKKIQRTLKLPGLEPLIAQWEQISIRGPQPRWDGRSDFAGLMEWGMKPLEPIHRVEYIIWKRPWMAISKHTFIGSVLEQTGFAGMVSDHGKKYPEIDLENYPDKSSTLLLFSSEPFPFAKISKALAALGFPYAIVDGESFSWFGLRSLRFLTREN